MTAAAGWFLTRVSQVLTVCEYTPLMSARRPSEADVLLAARSMIHQYGIDAAKEAVRRADDDLAKGEMLSSAAWRQIAAAIEKLQAEKPAPGQRVQ
jgi:hypothetical protein